MTRKNLVKTRHVKYEGSLPRDNPSLSSTGTVVSVMNAPERFASGAFGGRAEVRNVNAGSLHCVMLTVSRGAALRYVDAGNLHCIVNPLWHVALWELSSS